jgi:hypothetical protein
MPLIYSLVPTYPDNLNTNKVRGIPELKRSTGEKGTYLNKSHFPMIYWEVLSHIVPVYLPKEILSNMSV